MRVLICGDRNWDDYESIERQIEALPWNAIIIEGEARGADTMGRKAAIAAGLEVLAFPADWKRYGRAAGPIRNREMLEAEPDLVLAFHDDLTVSKGTKNMVEQARKAGVEVRVIGKPI